MPRATGELRGRIRCDDRDLAGWAVDLRRVDSPARRGSFALAADRSFVADALLPGRYHVAVLPPGSSGSFGAILADVVEVAADARLVREFVFMPRRVVLELRHPDGSAVGDSWLLRCGAHVVMGGAGARGVLDPAPELPLEIRLSNAVDAWSLPFQVPRDQRECTATIVVPPLPR